MSQPRNVNVHVPRPLLEKLQRESFESRLTYREIIGEALSRYFESKQEPAAKKTRRARVPV